MTRGFTVKETIHLPVQQVWRFLVDMDQCHTWMKGVNRVEPIVPGGPGLVGSRFKTKLSTTGRGAEREVMITAWEPNHRYALTSAEGGILATYEYLLAGRGNRTEMTLNAECSASGIWKMVSPLVLRMMKRHDGDQLALFKSAVEGHYQSSGVYA